ncbi:hypothetical protein Tco_0066636 [Tanacetum coccineum]
MEDYRYWKVKEEKEVNKQHFLEHAKDHKKQLAPMTRLNLFEDQSDYDSFYSDEENFEALDSEDAHLGIGSKILTVISMSKVGLYLERPVFLQGQLYVAVSRVKSKKGLKVLCCDKDGNYCNYTTNVVFKEVLHQL